MPAGPLRRAWRALRSAVAAAVEFDRGAMTEVAAVATRTQFDALAERLGCSEADVRVAIASIAERTSFTMTEVLDVGIKVDATDIAGWRHRVLGRVRELEFERIMGDG